MSDPMDQLEMLGEEHPEVLQEALAFARREAARKVAAFALQPHDRDVWVAMQDALHAYNSIGSAYVASSAWEMRDP